MEIHKLKYTDIFFQFCYSKRKGNSWIFLDAQIVYFFYKMAKFVSNKLEMKECHLRHFLYPYKFSFDNKFSLFSRDPSFSSYSCKWSLLLDPRTIDRVLKVFLMHDSKPSALLRYHSHFPLQKRLRCRHLRQ